LLEGEGGDISEGRGGWSQEAFWESGGFFLGGGKKKETRFFPVAEGKRKKERKPKRRGVILLAEGSGTSRRGIGELLQQREKKIGKKKRFLRQRSVKGRGGS